MNKKTSYLKIKLVLSLGVMMSFFTITRPCLAAEWRIVPGPKTVQIKDTLHAIPFGQKIAATHVEVAHLFLEELQYLGKMSAAKPNTLKAKYPTFIWGQDTSKERLQAADLPPANAEGYSLRIDAQGAIVRGRDLAGLSHGIQSLLQLIEQAVGDQWPETKVVDWPSLAWRGFHSALRLPNMLGFKKTEQCVIFYKWMLRRLSRYKYNYFCLMPMANIQLKSHPKLWDNGYSRAQIRELVAFGRARGIEVFPEIKTLGNFIHKGNRHAKKLRKPIKDLLEPLPNWAKMFGDVNANGKPMRANKTTFKITDPRVYTLITECIDDLIDLFDHPTYIHIGCDEATRFGASAAKEVDRGKMFANYVNTIHRYLKKKKIQTLMWDDMLVDQAQFPHFIEAHGGTPYFTASAIDYLDKDIILAAWHYGYTVDGVYPDRYPMIPYFVEKGFRVIGTSWFRTDGIANLAREIKRSETTGMLGSSWALHQAIRLAYGKTIANPRALRIAKIRRELSVLATTAEAAWCPSKAADQNYLFPNNSQWEKRWLPNPSVYDMTTLD